jgi:hypothetical protein
MEGRKGCCEEKKTPGPFLVSYLSLMGVWRFLVEGGGFNSFNRDWLCKDLSVVGLGLIGWIAPSSIPVINGNSLTGLFSASIGP